MTLLALGINHKTAPVSLRERVSFSPDKLDQALDSLLAQPMVQGGVVLSTCNRTELYLSVEEQDNLQEALIRWLCDYHNLNEEDLRKSLYWHQDNDAVSHLMRVASGLDSLVLGEPQILGQVKKAFADSQKGHMKASELERMFQKSFSVAKRVRYGHSVAGRRGRNYRAGGASSARTQSTEDDYRQPHSRTCPNSGR